MEKKLKVEELYQCINLLSGFQTNNEKGEVVNSVIGFCNEKAISEGIRRIANKTLKKVTDNYPKEQFQGIFNLHVKDLYNGALPENYEESGEDNARLVMLKQGKLKELADSEVVIVFEELPDWEVMNKRLEVNKTLVLTMFISLKDFF